MTSAEAVGAPAGPRLGEVLRGLWPPVRSVRFWVVQATVLLIAVLHDVVLVWLRARGGTLAVPGPVTSALLFIPVLYAALNFGVSGAVGTAVLSTLIIVPHWFLTGPISPMHVWMETGNLILLNAVAVVVGVGVERERRARRRAEQALTVAEVATARYQSLFGDHPAAVIITDADGVVSETNAAATRLFATASPGRRLGDVLGVGVPELLAGVPDLRLTTTDGEDRVFTPSAQLISPDAATRLVQIVLVDATERHRRHEEQRLFGARLITGQEDERRRLAADLHDDPLQTLMFISRGLDELAGDPRLPSDLADQARVDADLTTDVGRGLRKVIRGLRPPVLDDLGLVAALRQCVTDAAARPDAPALRLRVLGTPVRLPPQTELTAYRVVQESLSNVLRHAHANRVGVRVEFADDLTVTVTDDGVGIPERERRPAGAGRLPPDPGNRVASVVGGSQITGFGLVGMRERVSAASGHLEIRRRSPRGTTVRAILPMDANGASIDVTDG